MNLGHPGRSRTTGRPRRGTVRSRLNGVRHVTPCTTNHVPEVREASELILACESLRRLKKTDFLALDPILFSITNVERHTNTKRRPMKGRRYDSTYLVPPPNDVTNEIIRCHNGRKKTEQDVERVICDQSRLRHRPRGAGTGTT